MPTTNMYLMLLALILLIFLYNTVPASAQPPQNDQKPQTLGERLRPKFIGGRNDAAIALYPSIFPAQTPMQVRYALLIALSSRDVEAACHPTALSFLGTKDAIPQSFCTADLHEVVKSYMYVRVLRSEFPVIISVFTAFIISQGLDPSNMSTNKSTPVGWANMFGGRLVNHFTRDGWNSLGDAQSRFFRKPFADTTGYHPLNFPHLLPSRLRYPLRWQPLVQSYDRNGDYASQIHVVPHVGLKAKPISMTMTEFHSQRAKPLYASPNRYRTLSTSDERKLRAQSAYMLKKNAQMTERKYIEIA